MAASNRGKSLKPDDRKADEKRRRELAQANRGGVADLDGRPLEPRRLDTMVSVRLEPEIVESLRRVADANGWSLSDVLRNAAAAYVTTLGSVTAVWQISRIETGFESINPTANPPSSNGRSVSSSGLRLTKSA